MSTPNDPTPYEQHKLVRRDRSLAVLAEVGASPDLAHAGTIDVGVSRPGAVQFFLQTDARSIERATGYDFIVASKLIRFLAYAWGPALLLAIIALAFVSFGWYGAGALIIGPLLYIAAIGSAAFGRLVPTLLILGSVAALFLARNVPERLLAAAVGLCALNALQYHEIAQATALTAAQRGGEDLLRILVDHDVVDLRKRDSAAL